MRGTTQRSGMFLALAALLACAAISPAAESVSAAMMAEGDYVLEDPRGDVRVIATPDGPALPSSPRVDPVDLLSLTITEPSENLLQFQVATAGTWEFPPSIDDSFTGYDLQIDFQLEGNPSPLRIVVHGWAGIDQVDAVRIYYVRLCLASNAFCSSNVELPFETGERLSITLPKTYLTQDTPLKAVPAQSWPHTVETGAKITNLHVTVSHGQAISSGNFLPAEQVIGDRLPDQGEAEYEIRRGLGIPGLLVLPEGKVVATEGETLVNVLVRNDAAYRRVLQLNASARPTQGEDPWIVGITRSLDLGAGESANATLWVRPTGVDKHRSQLIAINATSIHDGGGSAVVEKLFAAAPPLVTGENTLYLHGVPGVPTPGAPNFGAHSAAFLSRIEDDPQADDERLLLMRNQVGILTLPSPVTMTRGLRAGADFEETFYDGFPNRATVGSAPLRAHLEFDAEAASQGVVAVRLLDPEDNPLATGETDASLASGATAVDLELPWSAPSRELGDAIAFVRVEIEYIPDAATASSSMARGVFLAPRTSHLVIPIGSVEPLPVAVEGPRAVLAPAEAREAFVNPGRTTVFHLDVRNEDEAAQPIGLKVRNATADWPFEITSDKFTLAPYGSARIGLVIKAPESAREGETLEFTLAGERSADRVEFGTLSFRATATRGVDIEEETFRTSSKMDGERIENEGTPGLAVVGLTAAIVVAVLVFRRRQG